MPASFSTWAMAAPTATILTALSVVRALAAGSVQACSSSSYVSVAWVCMISTWGAAECSSMLKGSGPETSAATSALVRSVQFLMVPAPQATVWPPASWV